MINACQAKSSTAHVAQSQEVGEAAPPSRAVVQAMIHFWLSEANGGTPADRDISKRIMSGLEDIGAYPLPIPPADLKALQDAGRFYQSVPQDILHDCLVALKPFEREGQPNCLVDMVQYVCAELAKHQAATQNQPAGSAEGDRARELVKQAVIPMMRECANSYANAWLEKWLTGARDIGAYTGATIGIISDLIDAEQALSILTTGAKK